MENNLTLYALTEQMARIEAQLEENGGEITPEIESLWEETKESLTQKADNYNALLVKLGSYSDNIDAEIKRLQALKKTADNSVKRIKEHIKDTMVQFGVDTIEGGLCKFSLANLNSMEVDEVTILAPFAKKIDKLNSALPAYVTVEAKISKSALKEAVKELPDGIGIAGVNFVPNKSLRIK